MERIKLKHFILLVLFLTVGAELFAQSEIEVDTGATAWMLTSTALVLLMIPGLAMFYGGLVRSKNVLGTMMHSFTAMGIMTVLWIILGYSMSFGPNVLGGWFGWSNEYFFLNGIDDSILEGGVPEYVFSMFQGKFAIITPALIAGAFAERISFRAYMVFIALWGILVYNPLCHWVWAEDGFLFNMGANGAIDFAGGTVVHISAGVSGVVAAIYLGPRRGYPNIASRPNNLVMTIIGAGLLWVGWFGFNAGSSVASGLSTAQALTATQAAAAAGALAWILLECLQYGRPSALGLVSGILAGLVAVTPAAGVVKPYGAMILGIVATLACYAFVSNKRRFGFDDTLDAFGIHGIGGIVGAIFLSFFIRESWMTDATASAVKSALIASGESWSIWQQLGVQSTAVGLSIVYAVVITFGVLFVVDKIFKLRPSVDAEMRGLDTVYHGERGYGMMNPN